MDILVCSIWYFCAAGGKQQTSPAVLLVPGTPRWSATLPTPATTPPWKLASRRRRRRSCWPTGDVLTWKEGKVHFGPVWLLWDRDLKWTAWVEASEPEILVSSAAAVMSNARRSFGQGSINTAIQNLSWYWGLMQKRLVLDFLHLACSSSLFRASSPDPRLQPPLNRLTELFSLGLSPMQTPQSVLILSGGLMSCP